MQGVKRGAVKSLRVVEAPEKRFWSPSAWNGQGQEAPGMGWHDFNNKRILGTVPVESDGSACFALPADTYVYFQLLDEKGMMIQSMRSGTIIQSGEWSGCVGCHDERRTAPPMAGSSMPLALRRASSKLDGWRGPPRLFNYLTDVQPVFDKNCVTCHDFGGKGSGKLVLARDRDQVFNASYIELWRKKYIASIGAGPMTTQPAYSWGSHPSKLVEVLRKGHQKIDLAPEDFDRIVTWIDINAPYYPSYAAVYPHNLGGRSPLDGNALHRLHGFTRASLDARTPMISFDRPAMSPCLAGLKSKGDPNYVAALAIVQAGREALLKNPNPDIEGFQSCETDRKREEKYQSRRAVELSVRSAIREGRKVYDPRPK
jgi:hypothetical protein